MHTDIRFGLTIAAAQDRPYVTFDRQSSGVHVQDITFTDSLVRGQRTARLDPAPTTPAPTDTRTSQPTATSAPPPVERAPQRQSRDDEGPGVGTAVGVVGTLGLVGGALITAPVWGPVAALSLALAEPAAAGAGVLAVTGTSVTASAGGTSVTVSPGVDLRAPVSVHVEQAAPDAPVLAFDEGDRTGPPVAAPPRPPRRPGGRGGDDDDCERRRNGLVVQEEALRNTARRLGAAAADVPVSVNPDFLQNPEEENPTEADPANPIAMRLVFRWAQHDFPDDFGPAPTPGPDRYFHFAKFYEGRFYLYEDSVRSYNRRCGERYGAYVPNLPSPSLLRPRPGPSGGPNPGQN